MNINGDITKKLIDLQRENSTKEFYKENRFLIFALSLLGKKSTVVSTILNEMNMGEKEAIEYIESLRELNSLSVEDEKILNRAIKLKENREKFNDAINEILEQLNSLTNKRMTPTPRRKTRIRNLLSSKQYNVEDFKRVNRYFVSIWGKSAKMKQYLVPETLYNEKFDFRVETSKEHQENVRGYLEEIEKLYQSFPSLFKHEMEIKNTPLLEFKRDVVIEEEDLTKDLPYALQITIIHWLETGYSRQTIEDTISKTVESWSKKKDLIPYISISKILDDKFPERAKVVERLLKQNSKPSFKASVAAVDGWSA